MPPVACYPTTSDGAVAVLCPHRQALGARLAEHPISLGDGAVRVNDTVAVGSLGTCLESTTAQAISLGQVEQQGSPEGSDHTGLGDQASSTRLSIAKEGSEAGGGDQLEHRSGARGG